MKITDPRILWIIDYLTSRRKELRCSQNELAKRTGLYRQAIYDIEHYARVPSIEVVFRLCDALQVNLEDILSKLPKHID